MQRLTISTLASGSITSISRASLSWTNSPSCGKEDKYVLINNVSDTEFISEHNLTEEVFNNKLSNWVSILKEANYKCNVYTSPHVISINERFVYNDEMIGDDDLANLLSEVHEVNNGKPLTYFEALTAGFFLGCMKYQDNIVLAEFGLFGRGDAVNILKKNLANCITSISYDHLEWLPENDRTIERIIYEKTSSLLNSNIIVAKQSSNKIVECIKKNISNNSANKIFYKEDYNFVLKENDFFLYEDQYGSLKIPKPSIKGDFQLENASTAIATLRILKESVSYTHLRAHET